MTESQVLEISTLGGLSIRLAGEPVSGLASRKVEALLVYVACTRRPQSRDVLADMLWDNLSQSRAMGNLRVALHSLRKQLAPYLAVTRDSVGLNPENRARLDVTELDDALTAISERGGLRSSADADRVAGALSLYKGDFLEGFHVRGCERFEEWMRLEQERLRGLVVKGLRDLLDYQLAHSEYEAGLAHARRLLELDPWIEAAHRGVMTCLALSGQRAAALRQYTECERVLQEDLGISPEDETTALFDAIKEGRDLRLPGAPVTAPVTPQADPLRDRYRLGEVLGHGRMGLVYRTRDTVLERDVAVKVLSRTALGTEGRARLLHEARSAATLSHPNILTVHDVGESDGSAFIVMELVKGPSLHERRPEGLDEILAIARQICAALEHAHGHGIVHRDLKPQNVLLGPDGTVKLMDFGLARSVASWLTSEGTIASTVFYMAPELALGQDFDGRADLYALGVMLYELTTGRLPFVAEDPVAVISQHLYAPVVPPRARNDRIPPALDALILGLLSKNPDDRPASAAEVGERLAAPDILDREAGPARELSVLERIERGRLVGRDRDLREARILWSRALGGQGQMLLISGEPGIGKTRLLRELITQVRVSGGKALLGASYAEGGAPYAPFKQIIRDVLRRDWYRALEDSLELPQSVLADLLVLAPELAPRFPDVPANPPLDPRSEQRRLFEHLSIFFSALSDHTPLLVAVEDAHWADRGSLFLLRHLARHTRGQRVMLVATYREVELDAARPLYEVLLDLERERLATGLKLLRLGRDTTRDMLAVLFGEGITAEFLGGIYRVTEGNPFFIEEVCKALVESGKVYFHDGRWDRPSMGALGIPQSVRVAIRSRLRVLPDDAQETLRMAAILGRVFEFDTLAAACAPDSDEAAPGARRGRTGWAVDEDSLIDALEDAERAQLIEGVSGEGGGTFAFVHGLIPSTLVQSTRTLRRRRLHRRAAMAIEACHPDDFEALAHHWSSAEETQKASRYMFKAGQRAARQYSNQEALEYFGQALEHVLEDKEYDRILKERARIRLDQYRGVEAARDYEQLLQSARKRGDRKAELDGLIGLAQAYCIAAYDAQDLDLVSRSRELCDAAYALGLELDDKASMARALITTKGFVNFWPEYADQAAANIKEAQALSNESGDEELTVISRCVRLPHLSGPERIEEAAALLRILESRHDLPRLKEVFFALMGTHLGWGNFEKCVECCDAGIRLAAEIGVAPVQYPTIKALALLRLGRYGAAWEALQEEVAGDEHPFGSAMRDMGTGVFLLELMAHDRAAEIFESVDRQAGRLKRPWMRRWAQGYLGRSLVQAGRFDKADLEEFIHSLASTSMGLYSPGLAEKNAANLAEIQLGAGRPDEALRLADKARSQFEENGSRSPYVCCLEVQLRTLLRLDRSAEVLSLANVGVEVAEEMGYLPMLWRIRAAKAQALEALGDGDGALPEYEAAAEIIHALAETIPDAELKHGFLGDPVVSAITAASGRTPK